IILALYSVKRTVINKERSAAALIVVICLILSITLPVYVGGLIGVSERLVVLMIAASIAHLLSRWKKNIPRKFLLPAALVLSILSYLWNVSAIAKFNSMIAKGEIPSSDGHLGIYPF